MFDVDDTIVGIASAPGGAIRGVVRLSGPRVVDCLTACFESTDNINLAQLRRATVVPGTIDTGPPFGKLPGDLYVWPTARSYTRQPAAEFHTFGAAPILKAVERTICCCGGRLAQPGEFTMRAFLAGRIDLTQAEAVLGVIDARNRTELETALSQLAGGLSAPLHEVRNQMLDLLAHLEAGLDFVEEDIEFISPAELDRQLAAAAAGIQRIAARLESREQADESPKVVLVGWPNAGKSSLYNALVGDAAAIVTDQAGTTRDYLAHRLVIEGVAVTLVDTAGFESVSDQLGNAAQRLTGAQARQARLRLICLDSTRMLNDWERRKLAEPQQREDCERILVLTKCDAPRATDLAEPAVETSSTTGQGLDALGKAIRDRLETLGDNGAVPSTATRCRESLRLAAAGLNQAREASRDRLGEELVAIDVRSALDELGKVVGAVYTDDILDRIFGRFCIGK